MNVNVKLSITDIDRDLLANYIDGKKSKRLATRADINKLVTELLDSVVHSTYGRQEDAEYRGADYGDDDDQVIEKFCGDDCCRQNVLLLDRVNRLQRKLEEKRGVK